MAHKTGDRKVVSDGDVSAASDGLNGNRIFVSVAKTINLGNYESVRVEFGCGSVVKDGQEFDEVADGIKKYVWTSLSSMVKVIEQHVKR